jgi:hypothetical protein
MRFVFQSWNEKRPPLVGALAANRMLLAEWTGLEPATPGVTGRCANSTFPPRTAALYIPKSAKDVTQRRGLREFNSKVSGLAP